VRYNDHYEDNFTQARKELMHQWEATVVVKGSLAPNGVPSTMQCAARNYLEARLYFEKFGRIIMGPRQIS